MWWLLKKPFWATWNRPKRRKQGAAKLLGRWGRNTPSVVFFLHCGHQSWTHSRGWRSWFEGLRNFVFGCAVTSWTQAWSEEMSDGPRDEEDGSGGTKEAETFQTHGDSAQDASPLCRCWFSLIDLLTVPVCFIHWYQFKAFGLIYSLSLG